MGGTAFCDPSASLEMTDTPDRPGAPPAKREPAAGLLGPVGGVLPRPLEPPVEEVDGRFNWPEAAGMPPPSMMALSVASMSQLLLARASSICSAVHMPACELPLPLPLPLLLLLLVDCMRMLESTSNGVIETPSKSSSDVDVAVPINLERCSSEEPKEVLAELYHDPPLALLGGGSPGTPKLSAVVRLCTDDVEAVCMLLGRPAASVLLSPLALLKGTGTATAPPATADDDDKKDAVLPSAVAKGENSSSSEFSSDCAPAVEEEEAVPSVSALAQGSCCAGEKGEPDPFVGVA